LTTNSSYTKTLERNVEGRRYTVCYIEPSFDKEERKEEVKRDMARQLYDIFAKYYDNAKNNTANAVERTFKNDCNICKTIRQ
jgi:hypothetical protein